MKQELLSTQMTTKFRNIAMVAAVAVSSLMATVSSAAPVTCPDNAPNTITVVNSVTLDPSAGCWAYGNGNINGNVQDPILNGANGNNTFYMGGAWSTIAGLQILDKSDVAGFALDGVLGGDVTGSGMGTITVGAGAVPKFQSFLLGLKFGIGATDDKNDKDGDGKLENGFEWVAFLIDGPGSYKWTNTKGGLSHVNLYGVRCVPTDDNDCGGGGGGGGGDPVPEPALIGLLGLGLAGVGLARRRAARGQR